MLRKILTTIGTRYLIAILNLALIFVNAKVLGIEGVGMVGLLVASINITVIEPTMMSVNQCAPIITLGNAKTTKIIRAIRPATLPK